MGSERIHRHQKPSFTTKHGSAGRQLSGTSLGNQRREIRHILRKPEMGTELRIDSSDNQYERLEESRLVRTKAGPHSKTKAPPGLQSQIEGLSGKGIPLPLTERSFFEPRFGVDFSDVRIHTGRKAARAAESVQARAFTLGSNVVFGRGQFAPGTSYGRRLIGHELTHVLQQKESPNKNSFPHIQRLKIRNCDSHPQLPVQDPSVVRSAHEGAIAKLRRAYERSRSPGFSDVQTAANHWFGITQFHTAEGLIRSNWQIVIDSLHRMNRRAHRSVYHCHPTATGRCAASNTYAWTGLFRIHLCPYWWDSGFNADDRVRMLIHEWAHRWIRVGPEYGVYGQSAISNIPNIRRRTRIADAYAGYICDF